jgi:solute carrier family 29 (equilibrative nucleoside transporter), member 1/2/3
MPAHSIELQTVTNMDRVKRFFQPEPEQPYEPIQDDIHDDGESTVGDGSDSGTQERTFSWMEYFIFMLLGVAMLWAW